MSNSLRLSAALTLGLILLVMLAIGRVTAFKQDIPITILQAPADSVVIFSSAGAILTSPKSGQFLYVNDTTGAVMEYAEDKPKPFSAHPLVATSGPVAVSADGHIAYVDKDSFVVLVDPNGQQVAKISTYPALSLGILSNGNILVASRGVNGRFLHLYDQIGQLLLSFGDLDSYRSSNIYGGGIPKGKIVVDSMDNIYYVFQYIPLIQKYSSTGELVFERKVTGKAIDVQEEVAHRFFTIKSQKAAGGVHIINSATIDYTTGHLWLCLNGSSRIGVIYEYNEEGEKLREYVLQVVSPPAVKRRITGVQDIAVTGFNLYVVDIYNQILSFNLSSSQTLNALDANKVLSESDPPCGNSQTLPTTCNFKCPGLTCEGNPRQPTATSSDDATVDCKVALEGAIQLAGNTVVGSNCQQISTGTPMHMRGGCSYSITLCKNGINTTHSTSIDCQAPTGSCSSGGGGGECGEPEMCDWGMGESWDFAQCCCANASGICSQTPIVIDVLGNGFDLTDVADGVNFDLKPDGIAEHLSWTSASSDDVWLALDRDGNGVIDNGAELFGNHTPQPTPPPGKSKNGFLALAEFDKPSNGGNGDGQIDNRDSIFSFLRLWQDINHNGISEPTELHSLTELGVAVLELDYKKSKRTDQYGNQFRYRAKVKDVHGAQVGRWAWDVFLMKQ